MGNALNNVLDEMFPHPPTQEEVWMKEDAEIEQKEQTPDSDDPDEPTESRLRY